jgi:hypothetical protein
MFNESVQRSESCLWTLWTDFFVSGEGRIPENASYLYLMCCSASMRQCPIASS